MARDTQTRNCLKVSIPDKITPALKALPICAVDLGFAATKESCGLAYANHRPDPKELPKADFGSLADRLSNWIAKASGKECVLILEAPLSHQFKRADGITSGPGNPAPRPFESARNYPKLPPVKGKHCEWYSGPGATVSLAVITLLVELRGMDCDKVVHLFEGFHPRWLVDKEKKDAENWDDAQVAAKLLQGFRSTRPRCVKGGTASPTSPPRLAGLPLLLGHDNRAPLVVFASKRLFRTYQPPETSGHPSNRDLPPSRTV